MHAELTMNVTNAAPSRIHERRAEWGGVASICLLSFGAGYVARYLARHHAIATGPSLAAIDRAVIIFADAHVLVAAANGQRRLSSQLLRSQTPVCKAPEFPAAPWIATTAVRVQQA